MRKAMLCLLVVTAARADSVSTTDKLTVFGHVERMDKAQLVLTSRYSSSKGLETEKVQISRSQVVKIEFDDTTFNPGGAPAVGLRPPDRSKAATKQEGQEVVVMFDGSRRACPGATIDDHQILHCGSHAYHESEVLRLLLGRP